MLNLLPLAEKKNVRREYRFRLAVIVVSAIAFLVVVNAVLLVPTYIRAFSKHTFAEHELTNAMGRLEFQQTRDLAEKDVAAEIGDINKKLGLFNTTGNTDIKKPIIASEAFRKIIGLKTFEIRISGITYVLGADGERFVVSGISVDRDSLALFVETLKKDGLFDRVELPIASYVKSSDIDFSISLERGAGQVGGVKK